MSLINKSVFQNNGGQLGAVYFLLLCVYIYIYCLAHICTICPSVITGQNMDIILPAFHVSHCCC